MREVITYVAYDGEEFDNREACEKYEGNTFEYLTEIFNSYRFFMENGQEIFIFLNGIEEGLSVFEYAWNKCSRIEITKVVSKEADDFINDYYGYGFPDNEIGMYEYKKYEGWVKVDE